MRRAFDLTFSTKRGDFRISVTIEKSFDERMSFRTGYRSSPDAAPRTIKMIKVVPKDPSLQKITTRKQIAHVCQQEELESLHPTGEENSDGEPEFVVIDKKSLKNMFPSSPEMRVLRTVPASAVPLHYVEKSHYFLNVKKTKSGKTRVSNPEDEAMYGFVHQGLRDNNEVLLVRYTAMNTHKYAVIYADHCGLRMSNMIASNYQRKRKEKQRLGSKVNAKLYDRLVGSSRKDRMNLGDIRDDYADKLNEVVEAAMNGQTYESKEAPKLSCFSRLAALEVDSDEEADDSESDDEDDKIKRKPSKTKKSLRRGDKRKQRKKVPESDSDDSDSD